MEGNNHDKNSVYPFVLIAEEHFPKLLIVLKKRLPRSCHVHNMVLTQPRYKDRMKIYTFEGNLEHDAWIIAHSRREDMGADINISVPLNPEITDRIKDAFINSGLIDWSKPYLFPVTDRSISRMFLEIGGYIKGNNMRLFPCYLYYANISDASSFEIESPDEGEIQKLDMEHGVEFILKHWRFCRPGTKEYIQYILSKNDFTSVGVYIDGKPVSGVLTFVNGTIAMLNTTKEHQRKGYAKICMKTLMKQLADSGLVPCSAAEMSNIPSQKLHEALGMKFSHVVDYIGSG